MESEYPFSLEFAQHIDRSLIDAAHGLLTQMQCLYVPVGDSLESAKKVHVIFVPDFEVSKFKEKETTCLLKIVKNEEDDITGVPI